MRVLIAGGGTAGHINPALAILSIIKEREPDSVFLYAGTPDGMESRLVPRAGIDFAPIEVAGFQRRLSAENIARNAKAVHYLLHSGNKAYRIIRDFVPEIVIGTGGYVSGPVVYTAQVMGLPTVIHEQNAYPGVTTRALAKKADAVMLTMPQARDYMGDVAKMVDTGLPVRKEFYSLPDRKAAKRELGLDENALCIFSWGGSLGAGAINEAAQKLIRWEEGCGFPVSHIHSYGRMGHDTFEKSLTDAGVDLSRKGLIVKEFIYNMDICTAAADIIICRSGASAVTELEVAGRASVLIPSPNVAGDHQYHNAMVLGSAGAAIVLREKEIEENTVLDTVKGLLEDPDRITELEHRAAALAVPDVEDRIYNIISEVVRDRWEDIERIDNRLRDRRRRRRRQDNDRRRGLPDTREEAVERRQNTEDRRKGDRRSQD